MPENKPEITKYRIRQGWDHESNTGTYAIEAKTPQSARFGLLSFQGKPAVYRDKALAEKALAVVLLRDKLARAEAEFAEAYKPMIEIYLGDPAMPDDQVRLGGDTDQAA